MLDIRLKELKTDIYIKAQESLKLLGFKGNKNQMIFTKKDNALEIVIAFGFSDYYPIDYQFQFLVTLFYLDLSKLLTPFLEELEKDSCVKMNIIKNRVHITLFEGQFVKSLIDASAKEKRAYYHSISSVKFADIFINEALNTLINKIIPFINTIKNLDDFQNFIMNNTGYLKENFERVEFFVSALFACKIYENENCATVFKEMEQLLRDQNEIGKNYPEHTFYLEKIKSYSLNNN